MKLRFYCYLIFFGFVLSGCSWVERFVIFNTLNESILVNYTLTQPDENGFAIFDQYVECYELKNNQNFDWNKSISVVDTDSSQFSFSFEIPAQTAFIFGHLHNDSYEGYDQYFINGRSFNLESLEIISSTQKVSTTPEAFDQLFKKKDGVIGYEVK